MDKKIRKLKERFRKASISEIHTIDKAMNELAEKDSLAFSKALIKTSKETLKEIDAIILNKNL